MDTPLSDLGCAITLPTDSSRVHAAGLSARGRAHAGARRTAGASHHGSGEAGLAGAATSHQRFAGATRYRRYLGCNHCERVRPGISLSECSPTDGLLRGSTERGFQWQATRRGSITKTGNAHLRRIVVEAAWSYRRPPKNDETTTTNEPIDCAG